MMKPLASRLLEWFDRNRRPLPWRRSRDPYRVWVSEVMLQQTTVAAAVPYYRRFMREFPTVHKLAAAREEQVLKQWEGLGYYRRARHLHAAAKVIVTKHGGQFPHDPVLAAELPGVGRYILGAVLSQAFGSRVPIVEANSLRVIARLHAVQADPRQGSGQREVWRLAELMLPHDRVGDFNQALMELGALVCTPRQPKCQDCPLRRGCRAYQTGRQELIPPPKQVKTKERVRLIAVALRRRSRWLLARRPADSTRYAGYWEFPQGDATTTDARRIASEVAGLSIDDARRAGVHRYVITRFSIEVSLFLAEAPEGKPHGPNHTSFRWCTPAEWNRLPLSTPQRKLLAMATGE